MTLKKHFRIVRNLICAIGLIIISPFLFFASLMIIIEDGMPIFFIQERVGKNKTIFKIIKLRTLKVEAPNTGTHQLDKKYHLVCGKLFRKMKLDEFPQLINVLMGDINLIGPRPGLTSQKELTKLRSAKGVYEIKPGITGLSQVLGYDMSDPMKLAEIDKLYIEKKSIYMNFLILLGTFVRFPKNTLIKLIT
jgi:lipopolysaccharide/colanic/teichoic acid biosynthesis glycosyltransferase|tara:strand:- start:593 stop:1168 length:576 start_codon:yes stop_codon:yes gene_type:complete